MVRHDSRSAAGGGGEWRGTCTFVQDRQRSGRRSLRTWRFSL